MMIKCPECGNDVSEYSAQCPRCGCPSSIYFSNENDLIFENRDGGLYVVGYSGESINIVIPSNHNGKEVVGIGKGAFCYGKEREGNTPKIATVKISDGIKFIDEEAFYCCKELSSIVFPKTLETIGKDAFYKCGLKEIVLPDGVTDIGANSFKYCLLLDKIIIPKSVINIGAHAFDYSLWMIKQQKVDPLVTINDTLVNGVNAKGKVYIPLKVSKIAPYAFAENLDMEHLIIPSNVREIGDSAFQSCARLKTVDIADGMEYIGKCAFVASRALSVINIPSSVSYIGGGAFVNIHDLTIYCELPCKADGWDDNWVASNVSVIWNITFHSSSFNF